MLQTSIRLVQVSQRGSDIAWVCEAEISAPKIDSAPKKCHAFRLSINACKNHCNQAKGRQIQKFKKCCSLMGDVTYSECAVQ